MSEKKFMSYGDAETIFTGYANEIKNKQDTLTFDATPTSASSNPVTSGGVYTALGTKANESMIGDAWNSSTTYGVAGNTSGYPVYCINNNVLYKCIQEHSGAAYEPPNASYWKATDVNTEITALNNSLTVENPPDINILPELKSATEDIYGNSVSSKITLTGSDTLGGSLYTITQHGVIYPDNVWYSTVGLQHYIQVVLSYKVGAKKIAGVLVSVNNGVLYHQLTLQIKDGSDNWVTLGSKTYTVQTNGETAFALDIDTSLYPVIKGFKISDTINERACLALKSLSIIAS